MADPDDITVVVEPSDQDIPESSSVGSMRRKLEKNKKEIQTTVSRSSEWMYKVPDSLTGISPNAIEPEIVSIGPYHRGKEKQLKFESYKWLFLDGLLARTKSNLKDYMEAMSRLEESTRSCYPDLDNLHCLSSESDFVEMMVLDGCFIVELFRHVCKYFYHDHVVGENEVLGENEVGGENEVFGENKDNPILAMSWLIPVLSRDLLKLENQLPFYVLEKLCDISRDHSKKEDSLDLLALKFFNISLPRPIEVLKSISATEGKHLLDLLRLSFLPSEPSTNPDDPSQKYHPSSEAIQCTTQLRSSGVDFKACKPNSFLEINFQSRVLQIPPITINDFTITFFINCMALEQCRQYTSTWFTTYIAFMSCLINSARDVTFLCSDGIISTGFSQNDQNVAELFKELGEKVRFNIRDSYLSQQFRDVEAYYSSHWATFMRTYFSKPWSFISVLSAFILLVLTGGQTVMSILSYMHETKNVTRN